MSLKSLGYEIVYSAVGIKVGQVLDMGGLYGYDTSTHEYVIYKTGYRSTSQAAIEDRLAASAFSVGTSTTSQPVATQYLNHPYGQVSQWDNKPAGTVVACPQEYAIILQYLPGSVFVIMAPSQSWDASKTYQPPQIGVRLTSGQLYDAKTLTAQISQNIRLGQNPLNGVSSALNVSAPATMTGEVRTATATTTAPTTATTPTATTLAVSTAAPTPTATTPTATTPSYTPVTPVTTTTTPRPSTPEPTVPTATDNILDAIGGEWLPASAKETISDVAQAAGAVPWYVWLIGGAALWFGTRSSKGGKR